MFFLRSLAVFITLLISTNLQATYWFENIINDAKHQSLGQASHLINGTAGAIYYNPANLIAINRFDVPIENSPKSIPSKDPFDLTGGTENTDLLKKPIFLNALGGFSTDIINNGLNNISSSLAAVYDRWAFGMGYHYQKDSKILENSNNSSVIAIAIAREWQKMVTGLSVQVYELGDEIFSTWTAALSLEPLPLLRIGWIMQNIGVIKNTYSTSLSDWQIYPENNLTFAVTIPGIQIQFMYNWKYIFEQSESKHYLGARWEIFSWLAIASGWNTDGLSHGFSIIGQKLRFYYAFTYKPESDEIINRNHQFSLEVLF